MKSIIITGASSGIGKAAAIRLATSGYQVFGLARRFEKLVMIASEIPRDSRGSFIPVKFDITDRADIDSVVDKILPQSHENTIYGLVNNAGYVQPGAIEDIDINDIRNQFETNFFGQIDMIMKVLPLMKKSGQGRIVNISSIAGILPVPLIGAYCASKHALEAVSEALKMELWNTEIKIVTINPGVIKTSIHEVTRSKLTKIAESRFYNAYSKYINKNPEGLSDTKVVDVIYRSIKDKNPKTRYIVGSSKEKLATKLRHFIPDKILFSQVSKRLV